ncbi:MAG TPA: hypothetical protein VG963_28305, partial [Polyangiaceae bacterium]|nr:hypothetical protein [Polyangiaceae bacterium]
KTIRSKAVLEFWEQRLGRKLTNREAAEMQSNVEGVIGLLAQWDRADREASCATPRKKRNARKE